ncbi:MAG: class I SAM-dependent methyltransferase [Pseudomonadota bacterium]
MLNILRSIAPDVLRTHIRMRRAYREHMRLEPKWVAIDPPLVAGAEVLNDVFELLDRLPKGAVGAEVGVATGGLSLQMLKRAQPNKLYLIDPWDVEDIEDYSPRSLARLEKTLSSQIASGQVEIRRGYSQAELPKLEANSIDWVYIDAAHDYDNVRLDLDACARVVRPGGIIAGHDYVRWVSPTERYGVVEAVNEFANETASKLTYLTNQLDKHDSFALTLGEVS